MKICITSGTYHPDVGGPPTYLYGLAEDLVKRGHQLNVVTYGQSRQNYPYPIHRVSRALPAPIRLGLFGLASLREARDADILYINDYGLPPTLANLILRKPVVMKIVGDFAWEYAVRHRLVPTGVSIDQFQRQRFGSAVERVRAMQSWYARHADLVITPSEYLSRIVGGWGVPPERLRVIYNAPTPLLPALHCENVPSYENLRVVTLARLAPWKGVDVLIEAVARARRIEPRIELWIIGDGEERAKLESLAAQIGEAVQFHGQLERGSALALMGVSDVVALCSAYEGLSHVLLEAMQAGRAIVATSVGGNIELIRDGENGLLVPYSDADALAAALLRLARDRELGWRLGAQARQDSEKYSWPRLVDSTLRVFEEALSLRARPRQSSTIP